MTNYEMEVFEKLLARLPKKYHHLVESIEYYDDGDLIDDCKFMLYFTDDTKVSEYYPTYPVKSITEAIYVIKCCASEIGL